MKKNQRLLSPLSRYAIPCLLLPLLAACGGDSGNSDVAPSGESEPPVTFVEKQFIDLTSDEQGLYRFGSDGSVSLLKSQGTVGSVSESLGELNGIAYFVGGTAMTGQGLWRTDGTGDGTYQVEPGLEVGFAGGIVYNNALYFAGRSAVYPGFALWKLVDEETGPQFVVNTRGSVTDNGSPSEFFEYDGHLLFSAYTDDGAGGTHEKVFIGTGTADNETLIDAGVSSMDAFDSDAALSFKGRLYFRGGAGTYGSGGKGYVLYKSNGTPAGTEILADINETGELASNAQIENLAGVGDYFIFPANDAADDDSNGSYDNQEIWASDGTAAGTAMIRDLHPGSSNIRSLVSTAATAYFVAREEGSAMAEIWRTQGTDATTVRIDSVDGDAYLYAEGDQVIAVTGSNGDGYVVSLLNAAGNGFTPLGTFTNSVNYAFSLGERLFVLSDSDPDGWRELWVYGQGDDAFTQVEVGEGSLLGVSAH